MAVMKAHVYTGTLSVGQLKQEKYLGDLEIDGKIILNGS
jgi:hypothetical protein